MSGHSGKDRRTAAGTEHSALVDVLGVRRTVDLGLLVDDRPQSGDWVLIHVGFAMSKISEADALDQLRMLAELGESDAAMEEVRGLRPGRGRCGQARRIDSTDVPESRHAICR